MKRGLFSFVLAALLPVALTVPRPELTGLAQANAAESAPSKPEASLPDWIAKAKLPVPEIERLPNGLQIAWFLDERIPVVDMIVLTEAGYRDDPEGKSGTAKLLSSVISRGAAGMDAQRLAREVEKLGASDYVSVDDDSASVGIHGLAPDAPRLLELLHAITVKPDFPQAEIEKTRDRMIEGMKHLGDSAHTLASYVYYRALASGTPYGRGGLLSMAELRKVTREDLIRFHQTHFRPDNAMLVVVGRVKKDEFRRRIAETFGSWAPVAAPKVKGQAKAFANPDLLPGKGQKGILVHRPGLTQAVVKVGFRAPPLDSPDHYPLTVANALFGEQFHSRLNSVIRDQLGLTYGIGSSFSYSKDLSAFTIEASTRNESAGEVIRRTLGILDELSKKPIPATEVETARDYLIGGFPLGTATLASAASRWLSGYVYDLGPGYLNELIPKVGSVTAEQVHAAVKRHLSPKPAELVIVVAGDAEKLAPSLKKAGYWPLKRIEVGDLIR